MTVIKNESLGKDNPGEPNLFEETQEPKPKRTRTFITILAIGSIALFFFWPKYEVKGTAILQAERFTKINLTGTGILKEVLYEKRTFVKKGDLLARFENHELKKELINKALKLLILHHEKSSLQNEIEFLTKEKSRKQILLENNALSVALYEKTSLDLSKASEEMAICENQIKSTESELQYLKTKEEALELKAPFDGVLLEDPKESIGNAFKEGDSVFEISDPSTYFLEITVPEKDAAKVSIGNKVTAYFDAFPWQKVTGEIVNIGSRAHLEIEKVFKVRNVVTFEIRIDEAPPDLKHGMQAKITIKTTNKGRSLGK